MNESLEKTRRQLRGYLIPETRKSLEFGAGDEIDQFPRSKVMRFAFNPRNKRILLLSGSVLGTVVSTLVGSGKLGVVSNIARSLLRNNK